MNRIHSIFRWLTTAALADWLITRTITRAGVFIPKSPVWIIAYQRATLIGQGASTLAGLLALVALGWVAWQEWQFYRKFALSIVLVILGGLSLLFLLIPASGWMAIANHLLLIFTVAALFWRAKHHPWLLIPVIALIASNLYQFLPALYETLHLAGPPPFSLMLFNLGEIFVVLSGLMFGWIFRHGATRREWILAAIPAIVFTGMFLSMPAMAGIFSIWSLGLTLFIPWPIYTLSIWAAGIAILTTFREKSEVGWAILLLTAGGYASQLSSQSFYSLIAIWMLAFILKNPEVQQDNVTNLQKPLKVQANFHA